MDELNFQLKMIDQLSGPSKAMDQSLSALDQALKREKAELASTEAALRSMGKATVVDVEAYRGLTAQMASQRDSVARLNTQMHQLGTSAAQAAAATKRLNAAQKEGKGGFLSSAEDAATSASSIESLGAKVGELANPYLLAAAAVTAFGGALAYALGSGVSLALSASQARGDTMDALGIVLDTQEAVEDTYDGLEEITSKLGVSAKSTQQIAESVALAGVSSKDALLDAVMAIQTAGKFSESAGSKIQSIIEKAGASGSFNVAEKAFKGAGVGMQDVLAQLSAQTGKGVAQLKAEMKAGKITAEEGVAALTKAVDVKLGAGALQKGRGFDESVQRIKNSLSTLFEKVNIEPFEKALARVADLLDTTSDSGKFLESVLVPVFDTVFRLLASLAYGAERGLLMLEIAFLAVYIAAKPLRDAWAEAFPDDKKDAVDGLSDAVMALGAVLVLSLGAGLALAAVLFAGVAVSVLLVLSPIILLTAAIFAVGYAVAWFVGKVIDAAKWLSGLADEAEKAGADLVMGLVKGLLDAIPRLIKAVKGVGSEAIKAFRGVFDSHSPSRVTMSIGADVSEGLAIGAEKHSPERRLRLVAQRSVEGMQAAPDLAGRPPPLTPTAGGAGGQSEAGKTVFDFSGMQVTITGVKDAEDVPGRLQEVFLNMFEQAALMAGSRPAGSGGVKAA